MKLLAVGDIHLGRTPSRLPEELAGRARELGPAEAWRRAVDAAIKAGVNAVLLAGDVVEKEDDFFEAYRELSQGVGRLTDAGIAIVGVAGNHDVRMLPRLAEQMSQFQLLGRGGEQVDFPASVVRWCAECQPLVEDVKWERCEIRDGNEVVSLWGWSFPRAQVKGSPLSGTRLERGPGVNLGLLHCDRGVAQSRYAPVANEALQQAGMDGWLLGHIHKPDDLAAQSSNGRFALNGYLGSLTGLDRSETGLRGPWLITVEGGHIAEVEQLPLAPLRWEHLEVPLDGLGAENAKEETGTTETQQREEPLPGPNPDGIREKVRGCLLQQVREFDAALNGQTNHTMEAEPALNEENLRPTAVGLCIRFTGRTNFGAAAADAFSQADLQHIFDGEGGVHYFVESIQVDTRPEIDLRELAQRPDPVGLLAQRLLWLEQSEGAAAVEGQAEQGELIEAARRQATLIEEAKQRLDARAGHLRWNGLPAATPDSAEWLRKSGFRALDLLLAQKTNRP